MKIQEHNNLPRGRAHLWAIMVELTGSQGAFSLRDLLGRQNGMGRSAVKNWLAYCRYEGAVEVASRSTLRNGFPTATYRVIPGRVSPPVQRLKNSDFGDRQQNLWNALRATKSFIPTRDLATAASTDTLQITQAVTARYCSSLLHAGYLIRFLGPRNVAAYRLRANRNTGPRAPAALKKGGVYDFNLRRRVDGSETVGEAA